MNELNDFLKLIAEGKKNDPVAVKHKELKENIKGDLGGLFSQLSSLRAEDPKAVQSKKIETNVQEGVKKDLGSLFAELAALKNKKYEILEEHPQLVEEVLVEVAPVNTPIGEVPPEQQEPAIANLPAIDKYLKSPQFKEPQKQDIDASREITLINNKMKFLEQWIGKIQNTGPGSGEVNFRYLDDVNRGTMNDSNDNWILEYDAATKKVQFTTDIGLVNSIHTKSLHVTENAVVDGTLTVHDDTTINGNLTVNGDITYINTEVLDVTDKNITIAKGATALTADGAGITVDGANAHITYVQLGDKWAFDKNVDISGTLDVTNATHLKSTLRVDGESTLASATVSDLTNTRIVLAGTNGSLEDSANFTFNGTQLNIGLGNFTVQQSSGNVYVKGTLQVDGTATLNGNVNVGSDSADLVAVNARLSTDLVPSTDYTKNLGDITHHFNELYANNANLKSLILNPLGKTDTAVPGMIAWNPDEDCIDVYQADGTVWQGGLEQYIRVHNHTASTMTNGTVVMFAGVENTNAVAMPVVGKYIADGSTPPLFLIGVLTSDILAGGIGRATTFGYVRNLNTTGSSVGETWAQGDLLWGHPTIAGAMTKVRPTAPNVVTSIAAVAKVGTTDGQLLVRPTIWPRLFYGDWYSTQNQVHTVINTPSRITLNNTGLTSGFTNNAGLITAQNAGSYNFQFSLQLTSSNSSAQYLWIWYRKNGVDAPNSATKLSISSNSIVLAPSWNFPVSMQIGDTFELMWAADSLNMQLSALPATSFCPAIPSVILTVAQTNL